MIETTRTLCCDTCKEYFGASVIEEFDGAIFTRAEVRKIARRDGWRRLDEKDYCAECTASIKRREKVKR